MMKALGRALMVACVLPALWWLTIAAVGGAAEPYQAEPRNQMLSFARTLAPLVLVISLMQFGMISSFLDYRYRAAALDAPYPYYVVDPRAQ